MGYLTPPDPQGALAALASGAFRILAGGTDFYPALRDRPATGDIIDISRIPGLKSIALESGWWRIGAAVTWSGLVKTPLPACFDGLKMAAREVGSIQIQNAGTIAGNLCNASPAADGVPPLLVLDAMVEISSIAGVRTVPLARFIMGARKTALEEGEMVTAILVPDQPGRSVFCKLGARRYLVISIVSGAALLDVDDYGMIASARIAIGSCSPVAQRLSELEAMLVAHSIQDSVIAGIVRPEHFAILSPLDDVRADGPYRLEAAAQLTRRMLLDLQRRWARANP